MYIVFDLVEDILLRLPLKSIFKLKTVSKQWKSTLESRTFAEKRTSFQKNRKILSAIESEIEMVYLQCDDSIA
ncbi:F-box/kelch-repeat protein [Cardamine amara subsp. amara]|uniref:F-box/kelch-repeat protein n=1 Tax=Cardamine amara subsp. amara TaxID=228776 RepID=A0ABD1BES8_CARAN